MIKVGKFNIVLVIIVLLLSQVVLIADSANNNGGLSLTNLEFTYLSSIEQSLIVTSADNIVIDGSIGDGEYDYSEILDATSSFTMHYSIVGDTIYMGMEASATGWISVGWGTETSKMTDIDYVIGYVSSGTTYVEDFVGITGTTHASDISQGGTDDIIEFEGSDDGSTTIIEFSKLLDTGDTTADSVISPGDTTDIQWGYSSGDDFVSYHTGRGSILDFVFQLPPATSPDAPADLSSIPSEGQISLSWTAPADGGDPITDYTVKRGIATGIYTETFSAGFTDTDYIDTSVTNGQEYFYVVSASNGVGESVNSAEISATPGNLPDAPTNFIATGELNQVSLSWTSSVSDLPVTEYTVKRGAETGVYTNTFSAGTDTDFIDAGIINGITYYYSVSATSTIGESADATEVSATAFGAPTAPVLSVTTSDGTIDLKWDEPNNGGSSITGYNIYRGTVSGDTQYIDTTTSLGYNDSSIDKGAIYYYTITSLNINGESSKSNEVIATLVAKPGAPTDIIALVDDGQVRLFFAPPDDDGGSQISDYLIFRSTTSGSSYSFIGNTGGVLTYTDNGLLNGQTYYYIIRTITMVGDSLNSEELMVTPVSTPSAPQNPSVQTDDAVVYLTWFAPLTDSGLPITDYIVERSLSSGSDYAQIGSTTDLNYTDSTVSNNVQYYYIIKAVNSEGSTSSVVISVIPGSTPSEPLNVISSNDVSAITLDWSAPSSDGGSAITGYKIYRSTTSGSAYVLIGTTSELTYTDANIASGLSYYYVISAMSMVGESTYSTEVSGSIADLAGAPTDLIGIHGNTQASLSWTAPSNDGGSSITDYTVKRGTTSGVYTDTFSAGSSDTAYLDTGLTNGVTYYYVVVAVTSEGESTGSNEITVTPSTKPGIPNSLSAEYINNQVIISWESGGDGGAETTYHVEMRIMGPWFDLVSTTDLFYIDTTVTEGATYSYHISAENLNGETTYSIVLIFSVYGVPSAPLLLSGDNSAALSWSAPTYDGGRSISGYYVYRSAGMGGSYTYIGNTATTSYSDATAVSGETYFYVVSAINSEGEGEYSNEILITLANVPSVPLSPSSTHDDSSIFVEWLTPSSDGGSTITAYTIYRSTSSGSDFTLLGSSTFLNYTDDSAINGLTYYYFITANNTNGEGQYSVEISDMACTIPNAPTLTLTPADGQVTLEWVDNGDGGSTITGYKIYRSEISGNYGAELVTLGVVFTYDDDTVTNGVTYYYTVIAVNSEGESAEAIEQNSISSDVPSSPSNVVITVGADNIVLDWDVSNSDSPITNYEVYRSTTSGSNFELIGSPVTNSLTDDTVLEGITYYYVIVAVNPSGSSSQSSEVSGTTGVVSSEPLSISVVIPGNSIDLSWNVPSTGSVLEYRVYRSETSGSGYVLIASPVSLSYSDNSASSGITYYYVITAYNIAGESIYSTEISVTLSSIPTAPIDLGTNSAFDEITLTWTAPASDGGSSITGYKIFRSITLGSGYVEIASTDAATLTFFDSTFSVLGINYYYVVVAVNSNGDSGYSLVSIGHPGGVPDQVTDITLTSGNSEITLDWVAPYDGGFDVFYYYVIYRFDDSTGDFEFLVKVFDTTYVDTLLINGIIYEYRILAHNVMGNGIISATENAMPATVPSKPLNPSIITGDSMVQLSWDSPVDNGGIAITSYNIYRTDEIDGVFVLIGSSIINSFNDTGLKNGIEYFYKITAVSTEGESSYSEIIAGTPLTIPGRVNNVNLTQNGQEIEIYWEVPVDDGGLNITVYHIFRSLEEEINYEFIANATVQPYVDMVELGITYYYMVIAHTDVGCGNESDIAEITPTGVPDEPTELMGYSTNDTIILQWQIPHDHGVNMSHYVVYRQLEGGSIMIEIGNSTTAIYNDSALEAGVTYEYCVSAVNLLGESAFSITFIIESPIEEDEVNNPLPSDSTEPEDTESTEDENSTDAGIVIPQSLVITGYIIGFGVVLFLGTSVVLIKKGVV